MLTKSYLNVSTQEFVPNSTFFPTQIGEAQPRYFLTYSDILEQNKFMYKRMTFIDTTVYDIDFNALEAEFVTNNKLFF